MTTPNGAILVAILLAPIARQAPAASDCTPRMDADARNAVLGKLASRLEADYAVPQTATKLAQAVRGKQRSDAYRDISCAPELARRLTEDLYAVAHDRHLRVNYSFGPVPQGLPRPPTAEEIQQMRKLNGMIPELEILDGNVGYIRVNGVPPIAAARDAVAAGFAFVRRTDALIIDDRENHCGDPNTVSLYMSYLSAGPPYVVNTFHWRNGPIEQFKTTDLGELAYGARKPVFVLTSPETFSGGEELAYDLQVFKRGVVVGEVTGGGANPGGPESLGHQFVVNMPRGQAINPVTGGSWEGVGVKPDVAVGARQALSEAHRLAVERLISEMRDSVPRSLLEAVAMKLESVAQAESGEVIRLPDAQLIGTYELLAGQGPAVTIEDKSGRLVQRVSGFPDVQLIFIGGNRYKLEGSPEGSFTSFRLKDGNVQLLREAPGALPRIRGKQAASP